MNKSLKITPDQLSLVKQILKNCVPNIKVQAFGSRTHGKVKPYSDLDLALMTEYPLSLKLGAKLTEAFEESDLPFKVDIIDWASINESFKKTIQSSLMSLE